MRTEITRQQLSELIASRVEFTPVKGFRKTWTNNHKHIVEKRGAGEDVDHPVAVDWTADWTICGLTNSEFFALVTGGLVGEFRVWEVSSKTKKGVAEKVRENLVEELTYEMWSVVDYGFGYNEDIADAILSALTKGAN